ncbi:MAG: ribonuclease P protein component [Treponema sp.]|jgi:ribonuclease P protein component|nr:ribonuclease P protein component [Treponema sp.]
MRVFRFRKPERLKKRGEIQAVFSRRRVVTCPGAKLFVLENGLSYNRIAFTLGRKFGNAAERNRARRVGREAYRHLRRSLKPGYDLVLLVYPGDDSFVKRMEQLKLLFSRAGLCLPGMVRSGFSAELGSPLDPALSESRLPPSARRL